MSVAPLISVVVPTRNRASLLPPLLEALEAQRFGAYEVIVVDDASTDGTKEILAAWAGEDKVVLNTGTSSGSYRARNHGWVAARGTIVAFTDDDCRPERDWLAALARALQDPEVVAVQGMTVAIPGTITPFTHQIDQRVPGPPYRTCNMAYRRDVLCNLGGFDDQLRWYADNILGYRARELGKIAFAPHAVVHHPPRAREWRDQATWEARFAADAHHRQQLRRWGDEAAIVTRSALPIVLWIMRPIVKQSATHLRYAVAHPVRYAQGMHPMVQEKRAMLAAMRTYRGRPTGERPSGTGNDLPPLGPEPLVTVLIVTRNRTIPLTDTLVAVSSGSWARVELVVIDHAGDARTRAAAGEFGAIYRVAVGETLGAARQRGVELATGELVAFTDDDCVPDPDWVRALVDAFQGDHTLHGVQGKTVAEDGPPGSHAIRVHEPSALYETCNIAYHKEALERVGGFDTGFSGWFEDTALAARVLQHGAIGWAPHAIVTHRAMPRRALNRESWGRLLRDERRLAREYRSFYRRRRGPGFVATVLLRWVLGSPLKTLRREAGAAPGNPVAYLRLTLSLIRERADLLLALTDVWGEKGT